MEAMRNSWTDDRLDGFSKETYRRFDEVDRRFDRVEADIRELRSDLGGKLDLLQRTLMQFGGGIIVGLIGMIVTQI